jgi:hypothetical protein
VGSAPAVGSAVGCDVAVAVGTVVGAAVGALVATGTLVGAGIVVAAAIGVGKVASVGPQLTSNVRAPISAAHDNLIVYDGFTRSSFGVVSLKRIFWAVSVPGSC